MNQVRLWQIKLQDTAKFDAWLKNREGINFIGNYMEVMSEKKGRFGFRICLLKSKACVGF